MASVPRALRHGLRVEHLIAVAVAAGFVALASAGGGYAIEVRAAGAILVWWAVLVAILLGGLPRAPLSRWALGAGGCLAGLALLTALSMSWASDDGRAFAEIVRVAGYLGLFVLAAISAAGGRGRPWLAGLAIGLLIVAGLALGSRLQPHLFPEQQLPTFIPNVKARVSYPLNYWNGLGACMALATVLLVWLSGDAGGRLRRAVAAGAIPIPVLTLFFTSSRGGFLALAVGLIVLVAATPRRLPMLGGLAFGALGAAVLVAVAVGYDPLVAGDIETELAERQGDELTLAVPVFFLGIAGLRWLVDGFLERARPPRAAGLAGAAAGALVVVVAVVALNPVDRFAEFRKPPPTFAATERTFVSTEHLTSSRGNGRWQFWRSATRAFKDEPLAGLGAGAYEAWWTREGELLLPIRDAHSLYLETVAEVGLIGFLLIAAFLVLGALAALRRLAVDDRPPAWVAAGLAVLAAGATSASIDWTWELPAAFAPVVAAVAALTAFEGSRRLGRRLGLPLAIATSVVGLASILIAVLALAGEQKLDESRAVALRDPAKGVEEAQGARAVQPWAATPYLQIALSEELRGNLRGARSAINDALERAPEDWRLWLVAIRIRTRSADAPGALRALREFKRLHPRLPVFRPAPAPPPPSQPPPPASGAPVPPPPPSPSGHGEPGQPPQR